MYYFPSSLSYSITYLCTVYTCLLSLLLLLFCIYSILGFTLFGVGSFWPFFFVGLVLSFISTGGSLFLLARKYLCMRRRLFNFFFFNIFILFIEFPHACLLMTFGLVLDIRQCPLYGKQSGCRWVSSMELTGNCAFFFRPFYSPGVSVLFPF